MKALTLYIRLCLGLWVLVSSVANAADNTLEKAVMGTAQDQQLQNLFQTALNQNPSIQYALAMQSSALSEQKMMASLQGVEVRYKGDLSYASMQNSSFTRSGHRLEASYPLYEPDTNDLVSAASFRHEASKHQVEEIKQGLYLDISKQYYRYWSQQAELEYLQKELQSITDIKMQLKQRFKVGYQDINDISYIQARLDTNQADLLKSKQALQVTRVNMEALVGRGIEWKLLKAPQHLPPMIKNPQDQSSWQAHINEHPVLKRLGQSELAANSQIEYAKSRDGIMVSAYGAYINNQSDGNFYDDMQGVKAGIQLNVPIYLGDKTNSAIGKARADNQQLKALKRQKQLMLTASVKIAYMSVQSGLEQLKALKAALESNKQAVKAAEKGLTTGNRNILNLLDAQINRHKAEKEIQVIKNSIWQNWYLYRWSQGKTS